MKSIRSTFIGVISAVSFLALINAFKQEKSWTYDLKSVEFITSNADMINADLRVERVSRGVFSMSGTCTLNYDIIEGDDHEVEVTSYRSDNGIDDYRVLPFSVPRQHVFPFLNSIYKDMAMESLKACSDMPQFEDKFVPPIEKKTYTLTKCQFSQDGYPQYMQDGFYKILLSGYGTVEWSLAIFLEVQQRI